MKRFGEKIFQATVKFCRSNGLLANLSFFYTKGLDNCKKDWIIAFSTT